MFFDQLATFTAHARAASAFETPAPAASLDVPPHAPGPAMATAVEAIADPETRDYYRGLTEEGPMAMFDRAGLIDRQRARRELASQFQIVEPESDPGERAPNAVTKATFDRLAATYSDIRRGHSDLKFDTGGLSEADAAAFKSGAMADLASIMQTPHGRALVSMLHTNARDHQTTLTRTGDASRASTEADVLISESEVFKTDTAAGAGESARVRYAPGVPMRPDGASEPWLPIRSDVVLYHELAHALDATHGLTEPGTVPAPARAGDEGVARSEYKATGLGEFEAATLSENAYRRDRKQIAASGIGVRAGDDAMVPRTAYRTDRGA